MIFDTTTMTSANESRIYVDDITQRRLEIRFEDETYPFKILVNPWGRIFVRCLDFGASLSAITNKNSIARQFARCAQRCDEFVNRENKLCEHLQVPIFGLVMLEHEAQLIFFC